MKIGVLSDIHGNHYALQEVLRVARIEKIEQLLLLGDFVGYYYHPDIVMEMLADWDCISVRGNHEMILSQILGNEKPEAEIRKKYGSGHRLAIEKLSNTTVQTLVTAPDQRKIEIDNVKILMCHGSPWDANFYLYPDSEREMLDRCEDTSVDFVLVGHSHYPFVYRNKFSTLVNVGSVGQSRSMGGMASWLVINSANNTFELKATSYATEELEREIDRIDPEIRYLKDILKRNRN
jgi:putative phosphoesterase